MKYIYLSILTIASLSCGSNHNTASEAIVTEDIVKDSVESILPDELMAEAFEPSIDTEFNYFEDYANVLTKTDLIATFGEDALTDDVAWYAEGTVEKQITILKDTINNFELTYVWNDKNDSLAWISADYNLSNDGHQKLETKSGLRLGMTLDEMQKWNEASFEFSGFGWDYAGGIYREVGSKIEETGLVLILSEGDNLDYQKFGFITGDTGLKSDDDKLIGAGIHLYEMTKYIE